MGKIYTSRALLIILMLVFSISLSKAENPSKPSGCNDCNTSDKYLFAAKFESGQEDKKAKQTPDGIMKKSIRIINLGPVVNYKGIDYAPTVSADGRTLYFVSNRPGSKLRSDGVPSHDFWATKKAHALDTVFFPPYNIDTMPDFDKRGVNTSLNEGAASIAADKQTLYFTGCERPDGLGSCDIYRAEIAGDKWGRPVNLGRNVNSKYWDTQPAISPDKKRLYFVSDRPGPNGRANQDIWYSDWDEDMLEFKPAQNLTEINTSGRELSPFIAADGVTLFFASDGYKPNFGGLDFYVTRYNPETKQWSTPENLGEPINTSEDEYFITLPASGDVIYFSSKRTDLKGYQGDLDIFMAFVPTFFRAVNVKLAVVDECSGNNIPATVLIKNLTTGRIVHDTLTVNRTESEMVVTNADYGNPKDSLPSVDFEITVENAKYGKKTKVEKVMRPPVTENIEETKKFAFEVNVVITLGQRPSIEPVVAQGDYINRVKSEKRELANFHGLVMEEKQTWEVYPLLNYVFFDEGSSKLPDRYILFDNRADTKDFTDTTISGGTLEKYYHLLNIYGFRLNHYPDATVEIVGCIDDKSPDERDSKTARTRAQNVYDYLKNIWNIDESRMKITGGGKPKHPSNEKDSLGIQENRRVEILCSEWEVIKPVFFKDVVIEPQPVTMEFKLKNGIDDEIVARRRVEIKRGNEEWKTITDIGITDPKTVWNWKNIKGKYPIAPDETPFVAQLIVTASSGAECKSDSVVIPVKHIRSVDKRLESTIDSTKEKYSLILFPFDKFEPGPLNDRIMKDYVYSRCQFNSSIQVIGHTDVVGMFDHNKKLSENRAKSVYTGIMKQTGGAVGNIFTEGVGEDSPLFDNDLPEKRFYNRTVQVLIQTPIEKKK